MKAVCFRGSEALSMPATQAFDLVVSDLNMPGTSGLKFLNKIRQDHNESILALIIAYITDALEEKVHWLGIGYVTEPFERSLLVQFSHDLVGDAAIATTSDGRENAPCGNRGRLYA